MGKVATETGETLQEQGIIYKAIVQLMLSYGNRSCVVKGDMLKVLEELNNRADRRIAGMMAHHTTSG